MRRRWSSVTRGVRSVHVPEMPRCFKAFAEFWKCADSMDSGIQLTCESYFTMYSERMHSGLC